MLLLRKLESTVILLTICREKRKRELEEERKKCNAAFKTVPRDQPTRHKPPHAFEILRDQPDW